MSDAASEFSIEIPQEHDRLRADKAVHAAHGEISRSQIQRLFEKGLVWREEQALAKSDRVYAGDIISYSIPPPQPLDLRPIPIPLDVLYEDEHMIAINKRPGMVVHPGAGTGEDTLVHALLHHCSGQLSGIGGVERPGIVHRLDKETSGVIVAAKSDAAFAGLSKAFSERQVDKIYLALASGAPKLPGGRIEAPIGRHSVHRQRMTVRDDGRIAISDWEVASRFDNSATLFKVRIHTGRTHQIRVHLSHLGWPIAGDATYGWRDRDWPLPQPPPRILLHAWQLSLKHPVTHAPLELEATLPDDFAQVLDALRNQLGGEAESQVIE